MRGCSARHVRDAPLSRKGISSPVCCLVSAPLSLCHLRGGSRALRVSNCKWVVIVITGWVGGAGQSAWDGMRGEGEEGEGRLFRIGVGGGKEGKLPRSSHGLKDGAGPGRGRAGGRARRAVIGAGGREGGRPGDLVRMGVGGG